MGDQQSFPPYVEGRNWPSNNGMRVDGRRGSTRLSSVLPLLQRLNPGHLVGRLHPRLTGINRNECDKGGGGSDRRPRQCTLCVTLRQAKRLLACNVPSSRVVVDRRGQPMRFDQRPVDMSGANIHASSAIELGLTSAPSSRSAGSAATPSAWERRCSTSTVIRRLAQCSGVPRRACAA